LITLTNIINKMRKLSIHKRWALLVAVCLAFPFIGWSQPFGYAINSDDADQADQLLLINLATGDHSSMGSLPSAFSDVEGLAFSPDGRLYGADDSSKTLLLINTNDANAIAVDGSRFNLGFNPSTNFDFGMTFTCDGQILLVAEETQSLYNVDINEGSAQLIGQSGGLNDRMSAIASFGEFVFSLAPDNGTLYQIDTTTGTSQLVSTIAELGGANMDAGLAFDEAGVLWAIISDANSSENSRIYRVNPVAGTAEFVAETRIGIESLAISSTASCDSRGPFAAETVPSLSIPAMFLLIIVLLGIATTRFRQLKV